VLDRGFYCIGELLMFLGCLLVLGDYLCFLGFLWVWGASFVSWVFVGGLPLFFGFHGAYLCFFFFFGGLAGLFMCILPVYLGAPYAFLIKSSYL
jgi:hypothetical protein